MSRRWSCALCPASGLADNRDWAVSGAWHYQSKHREVS